MSVILRKVPCARILKCVEKYKRWSVSTKSLKRLYVANELNNNTVGASVFHSHRHHFHTCLPRWKIVQFNLSDIGEGIREVAVKEWFVKEGDVISQFDNVCEVQSDKATATITSRFDGKVTKLYYKINDTAFVGLPLIDVETSEEGDDDIPVVEEQTGNSNEPTSPPTLTEEQNIGGKLKVLTTPAVRRIASQHNVNLSEVTATGRNGRVLKEDVLKHLGMTSDESNIVPQKQSNDVPISVTKLEADKTIPITGFQKAMVKTMNASLKIPHFVLSDEYNLSKLVNLRKKLKASAEKDGVKLTFMPFIVKAVSLSLIHAPILNSAVDENCENIIYKSQHNIGIAMDTPNGLAVPVIKNVQDKSIIEIAKDLNRLQDLGVNGKLGMNNLTGGTFSISNIGNIGGTYTKPVILTPQVCIGAFGRIRPMPQFDEGGSVVKADLVAVSWSADHRVIDGATMARFSNNVRNYLENPEEFVLYI